MSDKDQRKDIFGFSFGDFFKLTFEGERFKSIVIPPYQRPYCWTQADIQKILDDVDELRYEPAGEDKFIYGGDGDDVAQYYFGSICFRKAKSSDSEDASDSELELLDGQQRLTTFLILGKLLSKLSEEADCQEISDAGKEIHTLMSVSDELAGSSVVHYTNPNTIVHIGEVYKEFDHHYRQLKDGDKDYYQRALKRDIARFLYVLKHGMLSVRFLRTERAARQFFQCENNRGKAMTVLDLLKAYHMRQSEPQVAEKINRFWSAIMKDELPKEGNGGSDGNKYTSVYALPVMLIPYGVPLWTNLTPIDAFHLKGILGTLSGDRIVDAKLRGGNDRDFSEIPDLLDTIQPGLAFFQTLDYYRALSKAIYKDVTNGGYEEPFGGGTQLLVYALVCWADRFLQWDWCKGDKFVGDAPISEDRIEELSARLKNDLDYAEYKRCYQVFLRRLKRDKNNIGAFDRLDSARIFRMLEYYYPVTNLLLLPHHSNSPAACRREFLRRTTPDELARHLDRFAEKYRTAYYDQTDDQKQVKNDAQ